MVTLTDIDEPAGSSSAKLLALETQCDFDYAGNVTWRGLDADRVGCYQLTPDQHCPEQNLDPIEEVVADDDDC